MEYICIDSLLYTYLFMKVLKKYGIQLTFVFFSLMSLFSLAAFQIFLFLTGFKEFGCDLPRIMGFFPTMSLVFGSIGFFQICGVIVSHQIWKNFGHDFFKYICLFCQPQSPVSALLWGLQLHIYSSLSSCPVVY